MSRTMRLIRKNISDLHGQVMSERGIRRVIMLRFGADKRTIEKWFSVFKEIGVLEETAPGEYRFNVL